MFWEVKQMCASPLTKDKKPSKYPPVMMCADCGTRFKPHDTSWDVHLAGTTYKTVCTACFENSETGWAETTEGTRKKAAPKLHG